MRFLVDNALSPLVAEVLAGRGHDALHVRDRNMAASSDEQIFDLAGAEDRVIVSADTDFGTLLALRDTSKPSLVIFRRSSGRSPREQARILLENLPALETALGRGAVVVFEESRVRIRLLPMDEAN